MSEADTELPAVFAALADDTRWSLLVRLGRSPASASALAAEFPVSRQAIAKHLAVLEETGLVSSAKSGREVRFTAVGERLSRVGRELDGIAAGWDRRLANIKVRAEVDPNR
jgi:DNA-binding transcriptional ArsR family regulator